MRTRISVIVAAVVALIASAIGAWALAPANAASQALSTKRGWCVKSSTGELRSLRLTIDGRCQANYWGPIALGNAAKGPKGDTGPQGPKGDQGPSGAAGVICIDGYTVKDIVVPNGAKTKADGAALTAAQNALADAKAALVAAEAVVEVRDNAITAAQAKVDAATSVEDRKKAEAALADAVVAKAAAVTAAAAAQKVVDAKQAAVDKVAAEIAAPGTFTIRTCVKG